MMFISEAIGGYIAYIVSIQDTDGSLKYIARSTVEFFDELSDSSYIHWTTTSNKDEAIKILCREETYSLVDQLLVEGFKVSVELITIKVGE